ncbi:MAG: hypothetical protein B7Z26_08720 [Asticcacaulis sp. 32-58-5]|nr:MAG: hypothetical protein B7Z26_08720 [Asticcacaulis sp. 32-58-5]
MTEHAHPNNQDNIFAENYDVEPAHFNEDKLSPKRSYLEWIGLGLAVTATAFQAVFTVFYLTHFIA